MPRKKKTNPVEGQQAFLEEGTLNLFLDWLSNFTEVTVAEPLEFDDDWEAPVIEKPKSYKTYESVDGKLRMTWAEYGCAPVKVEKLENDEWKIIFDKT